jgi:hypothetical protein
MRIGMQRGERKRVAEFNWTNNSDASKLVSEYRKAADQAMLVFDLAVARENQPLNAPKLMELFEAYLKRDALSIRASSSNCSMTSARTNTSRSSPATTPCD